MNHTSHITRAEVLFINLVYTATRMRKPRVLILSRSNPQLPISGARIRTKQQLDALAQMARVGLFVIHIDRSQKHEPIPEHNLDIWQSYYVPLSTGQVLRTLRHPSALVSNLFYSRSIERQLQNTLKTFQPDIVIFEEIWLHAYLPTVQAFGCDIVLDMHNVEQHLYTSICHETTNRATLRTTLLHIASRQIEPKLIGAAKQLWVCSQEEKHLAESMYSPHIPIYVIPSTIDSNRYQQAKPNHKKPRIIFCANFAYVPNAQGAKWMLEHVLPRLVLLQPNIEVLLVGNKPSNTMKKAAKQDKRIRITGYTSDVLPYLEQATVAICPLHLGGGTRLKILEAFAVNLPVVTTTKGAEGLPITDGTHAYIADDADTFASCIDTLLRTPIQQQRLAWHGKRLLAQNQQTQLVTLQSALSALCSHCDCSSQARMQSNVAGSAT